MLLDLCAVVVAAFLGYGGPPGAVVTVVLFGVTAVHSAVLDVVVDHIDRLMDVLTNVLHNLFHSPLIQK